MSLIKWGATWFILCLIGASLVGLGDYWFSMIFGDRYGGQFTSYISSFLLMGFILLFATIIIDSASWYIKGKELIQKT